MQRLIIDMPLMISAVMPHAADQHGTTEMVALAIGDSICRCDHATALTRAQQLPNALPRLGAQRSSRLLAWPGARVVRSLLDTQFDFS